MKNILKRIFISLLCTILILNSCIVTVYASEGDRESGGHQYEGPTQEELDELLEKMGLDGPPHEKISDSQRALWRWLFSQAGAIVKGDTADILENNDEFREKLKAVWTKENIQIKTDSNGKKSFVFAKVVSDTLLQGLKDAGKETENGGYELIKTVPVNKVSSLYFDYSADYRSMYDLLKANGGLMGIKIDRISKNAYFYKIDNGFYYVKGYGVTDRYQSFYSVNVYKTVSNTGITYDAYYLKSNSTAVSSWDDSNLGVATDDATIKQRAFFLNDLYSHKTKFYSDNPLESYTYLISSTGVSVPVFNKLNDLVSYTVANNLYYTTSDYTGEGQEITIDYDELDKILDGYYDKLYDMLQKLIDQNGGDSLTPEQLQELADQVIKAMKEGFGDIGGDIEDTNNILQALRNTIGQGIDDIKKLLGDIKKTLDDILDRVKEIKNWSVADTVFDGLDFLTDLADFIKDFFSDTSSGVGVLASGLSDTVNVATKKFPFSIPWDLAFLVSVLADTPEVPVFEIPFQLPSYGIDEKIVIDFTRFSAISEISRFLLTLIYTVGLLKFTNKIIGNRKGGTL